MMRTSIIFAVAAATVLSACGGKPAPEQPAPVATTANADSAARAARARQDSIDAANRARADEEARRRAAADQSGAATKVLADLKAMINFDYNVADIRSGDQATLDRKAAIMQANPSLRIRISGHADERGSDEYNLALGNRRAAAAQRYLQNKGVDVSRVDVISYGEERPLDTASTEDAYARNRRDEFDVTAGGDNLTAPK
jgi:peptidoglycan-associated lipoprotein